MNLLYLGKPTYGGWVSFTAHLSLKYNYKIYKIGKRTEKLKSGENRLRKFGYGTTYQNISIEDARNLPNIIITAIDKNYYKYIDEFSEKSSLVIHDPTEIKGNSCKPVIDVLNKYNIITIRRSVKDYLKNIYKIPSKFKVHPFFEYVKTNNSKTDSVSISRVDFDKHTDIILKANKLLPKDKLISVYGAKNDRYVYFKLKPANLGFDKYYKGSFKKSFEELDQILSSAKFVVDLSAIKNDGGGSQYTFLEAIYQDCILILNKKWVMAKGNIFIDGKNCILVEDETDIVNAITKKYTDVELKSFVKQAKKLLKDHINVKW